MPTTHPIREPFPMSDDPTKFGTITKVVHVGFHSPPPGMETDLTGCQQGYGILRGDDGQELFFVDSEVVDGAFHVLQIGQPVFYQIEHGPLARAHSVRVSSTGD